MSAKLLEGVLIVVSDLVNYFWLFGMVKKKKKLKEVIFRDSFFIITSRGVQPGKKSRGDLSMGYLNFYPGKLLSYSLKFSLLRFLFSKSH